MSLASGEEHPAPDRWVVHAMDTVFSLVIPGLSGRDGGDALAASLGHDLRRFEARLSVFSPDSEISRWRDGRAAEADLSPEARSVIAGCAQASALTGGAFSAWTEGGFDPTGYVKGWALDRLARRLDEAGVASYCLNGGGDVVARGLGASGAPWRVGLAHPYRPGEYATIVTAPSAERPRCDCPLPGRGSDSPTLAIASSGTSERGSHVVNPRTGWRPVHSMITVVGTDIALVDAVATAALALGQAGPDAPADLLRALGLEGFGFGEDRHPWWTPGMSAYALLPSV